MGKKKKKRLHLCRGGGIGAVSRFNFREEARKEIPSSMKKETQQTKMFRETIPREGLVGGGGRRDAIYLTH